MFQVIEPHQYLKRAKNVLQEDIKQGGRYYSNKKYVQKAGYLALKSVLSAMQKHFDFSGEFEFNLYQQAIQKVNPYMAKVFDNAYDTLCKALIQDGNLNKLIVEEGLREAKEIVDWCEATKKTEYTSSHS